MILSGGVEPDNAPGIVDDLEASSNMQGRRVYDMACVNDRELRGTPANVHCDNSFLRIVRNASGAGTIGSQHRLHVMPGAGTHEFASVTGNYAGNCRCVLSAQRLAGKDHNTGVDILRKETRGVIGFVKDRCWRRLLDTFVASVGSERNW